MSQQGDAYPTAPVPPAENSLRLYDIPGKAHLLLVCRKCQKKLRSNDEAANLKKALKRRGKRNPEGPRLRLLQVSCLKLCPKGGVTVCTQGHFARGECSIVRGAADVDALYARFREEAGCPT